MEHATERADIGGLASPSESMGPIIVGSDGAPASAPAFDVARRMAGRDGASVEIIPVVAPLDVMVASIARVATQRSARLVVIGRSHRRYVERVVRGETPLGIVRATGLPVLAVPPTMSSLPHRVVVAVGLGDAGAAIGPVARALLNDAVEVHLVHVSAPPLPRHERELRAEEMADDTSIEHAFERARAGWELPADVSTDTHVLVGDPYPKLLAFADGVDADLVVVGMALQAEAPHLPHRSLARRLYDGSSRAMLIVPVGETRQRRPREASTEMALDEAQWPDLIGHVGRRNTRRLTSIAIIDRIGAAHLLARARPLAGLSYDRHAHAVVVMLGDPSRPKRHLAHRVTRPLAVALHRNPSGLDDGLLIRYDRGRTLITFE